jgi:hypothetical protein
VFPSATEAWLAVFGGLIPIIGLAAIGYLIYRAVKDDSNDEPSPALAKKSDDGEDESQ